MSEEPIINKVAQSPLITFNLEDFLPRKVVDLDLSAFLEDGFLLREKPFREALKTHDYTPYEGSWVRVFCSTDAILPAWASILLASKLTDHDARAIWAATKEGFWAQYYRQVLEDVDWKAYEGKPMILKGCGDARVPQDAYLLAVSKLKPLAKKISYGEACSAVPLK